MTELEDLATLIQDEIYFLEKYRWNLKKTVFSILTIEKTKYSFHKKKCYKILDEVDRVTLEIDNLEKQKANILIK
jgi:hypothetical protein